MSDEEEVLEITYTPIGDDPFGAEEMFTQGAAALDLAAVFALENKDIDGLIRVAREWTRLGAAVAGIETLPEEKKTVLKFGFSKDHSEEENDGKADVSENDVEDNLQGKRRLRTHRNRSIR